MGLESLPMEKIIIMFKSFLPQLALLSLCGSLISLSPAFASTTTVMQPSKCLNASTIASHNSVTARMETDIAPYASNAAAADAIKLYRNNLAIAWDAMTEPYCGYGSMGVSAAARSYTKSVERERATFLTNVKNLSKSKGTTPPKPTAASTILTTTSVSMPAIAPTKAQTPTIIKQPTTSKPATITISSGLRTGMRSTMVTALQQKLASHFQITQDDNTITGYYGPKTANLVLRFQLEKKLVNSAKSPGAGAVGPKTARALNAL